MKHGNLMVLGTISQLDRKLIATIRLLIDF